VNLACRCLLVLGLTLGLSGHAGRVKAQPPARSTPVVVVETVRGTFRFVTFPNEAPVTVAHILALVNRHFYDGQRVHRAQAGFVVQFGDPQSRDLGKRDLWGRGDAAGSGTPIGVAEISDRRLHLAGAVGIAHAGDPARGDSQIYITLSRRPDLDGHYAVFAQLVDGDDVIARLAVGDEITRAYVQE
jgi:cyclophilin family peptidyl-prolyl cis-trans isomerase